MPALAHAHVGEHPSIHDTAAGIIARMADTVPSEKLVKITVPQVLEELTPEEREILGSKHIIFDVDVPVIISIFRQSGLTEDLFWLKDQGFKKTAHRITATKNEFETWQKAYPAGNIGLGVTSISGSGDHYFIGVAPQNAGDKVKVSNVYPGRHRVGTLAAGERPYVSWDDRTLTEVPKDLTGQIMIRGDENKRRSAKLIDIFRATDYVSTTTPDQVVLTWADDPKTTQTVQWRTSTKVDTGAVRFRTKSGGAWKTAKAETTLLTSHNTVNDPLAHRHTATMRGLEPATTYAYAVGDGSEKGWQTPAEFTTAPDGDVPFKFIYMGDAQNGLDTWGNLIQKAHVDEPDMAFYIMAGDLINRGNERDDWDSFFYNSAGIFDRKQLVPAIGNHEDQGDRGPWMYLELFDLPDNGPKTITNERAYSYEYGNALFVVLDSQESPAKQTAWLEEQLKNSDKTWKIMIYHAPMYSSGADRDNPRVRAAWGPLFDKYHVDLALQGHDHAYLRTYPMYNEKPVSSPKEGTIYIVSVSGTKYYDQGDFDYTEFGMTNVSTYQVLDIEIEGNKLSYKAYDINGDVRDQFVIEK
jgi:hypothetical protein